MENEDGTERLPVSPDMNSTQIECDRDCKVRKQVEKEIAEEKIKNGEKIGVLEGIPFRESYKQVGLEIEAGNFKPNKDVKHTHEGSLGNLCSENIKAKMDGNFAKIDRKVIDEAVKNLLA